MHVLDDLSTGSIENIRHLKGRPGFEYTIESLNNTAVVAELVDDADVVYHLAAAVGVQLIVESPVRTIETNVLHEDRPRSGEQEEKAGVRRLDERGLRQESRPSVSRGRGSDVGPDGERPLVVCVLESS